MIFNPWVYQTLIRNFILDHERCNIFASPGSGKTSATYDAFTILHMLGEAKRGLIIGPKRVAKNVWPSEQMKWHESFGHLKVAAAIGTPEQRQAAVMSKPDLLCINYDNLEWLIDGYGDDWPFDMVIPDEASRLKGLRVGMTQAGNIKGQGSVRAKKLAEVAHKHVRRWVNLTGSPAPNGLQDVYGIQWFIDQGLSLGSTFKAFQDRWFHAHATPDGYTQLRPYPSAQKQIEARIRPKTMTIDVKDWLPIGDPIERTILIDLPPKVRAAYLTMERELFANIEHESIHVFTAGSKSNKCLQIANGSVFYEAGKWVKAHDEKLEALRSIVEEFNGEPIFVRYIYKPDRDRILEAFGKRAVYLDDKQSTEDAWNRGDIPILVAHAAGAGHGLSLQHGGRVLVDYGSDFNLEHDEQIIERIGPTRQFQSGYKRAVFRFRIIARDTIEERSVLPRLQRKMSVQDALKNAMKIRA